MFFLKVFLIFISILYIFSVVFILFYFYYLRVGVMYLVDVADKTIFRFIYLRRFRLRLFS